MQKRKKTWKGSEARQGNQEISETGQGNVGNFSAMQGKHETVPRHVAETLKVRGM